MSQEKRVTLYETSHTLLNYACKTGSYLMEKILFSLKCPSGCSAFSSCDIMSDNIVTETRICIYETGAALRSCG